MTTTVDVGQPVVSGSLPGVAVWLIDLSQPITASEIACLSPPEKARAARFWAPRHRARYQRAHVKLRQLLASRIDCAASELVFVTDEYGKPRLVQAPALHFNLSHSEDTAVIAVSEVCEVGVDVEILRDVPDAMALAACHFTPDERMGLLTAQADQVSRRFLQGWTRKEACLKAIGAGLTLAPSAFEVNFSSARRRVTLSQPVCALQLASPELGTNVICAVARLE